MNTKNNRKEFFDFKKLRELPTFNEELDIRYGKKGTPSREAFRKEAYEYYYSEIAREESTIENNQQEVEPSALLTPKQVKV